MKEKFNIKIFFGFSLVELMVSLITIACITAAFAPIVSKKIKQEGVAGDTKREVLTGSACDKNKPARNGNCRMCYADSNECLYCTKPCDPGKKPNADCTDCEPT